MTTAIQPAGGAPAGGPNSNALADVIETILDKGLVIDAYVRLSVVGIEILTIDARVVVASVDTYLRFAEAVNRLDIGSEDPKSGLTDIVGDMTQGVAKGKTSGALEAAGEKLSEYLTQKTQQTQKAPKRVRSQRGTR